MWIRCARGTLATAPEAPDPAPRLLALVRGLAALRLLAAGRREVHLGGELVLRDELLHVAELPLLVRAERFRPGHRQGLRRRVVGPLRRADGRRPVAEHRERVLLL